MLLGCVLRAVFIVYLNTNARKHDPVAVSSFVSVFVAVISFMIWAYLQPETFRAIPTVQQVIGMIFVVAGSIVEIIKFKGKDRQEEREVG